MGKVPEYTLRAMKKYSQSPKGKAARKKYLLKNKEKISEYNRNYLKEYRNKLKANGVAKCLRCLKPNPDHLDHFNCKACREYLRKQTGGRKNGRRSERNKGGADSSKKEG